MHVHAGTSTKKQNISRVNIGYARKLTAWTLTHTQALFFLQTYIPVIVIRTVVLFIWKRQGTVRMAEAEASY